MSITLLRAADRIATPWRNGGGSTSEIACEPAGAGFDSLDWRVSIAEVAAPGPFSRFDGIVRVLCVLDGVLALSIEGAAPLLLDSEATPFAFAGDVPVHGAPVDGPVRDLNLMLRRGAWHATVARVAAGDATARVAHHAALMVATHADTRIVFGEDTVHLDRFDALRVDGRAASTPLRVSTGAVIAIQLAHAR